MEALDDLKQPQDREVLNGDEKYRQYFSLLNRLSLLLQKYYRSADAGDSREAMVVAGFLDRLAYTADVLHMKYAFQVNNLRPMWIDLTDSGFPNCEEFHSLKTDLQMRAERLQGIPPATLLKRRILEQMLSGGDEPVDLLAQMSERTYLEMLDESKLFLPFTPGELTKRESKNPDRRSYVFSWACFDFASNRPYVHLMMFEQDAVAEPLENSGQAYADFLRVLQAEGSRAPEVGILAMMVDDALESIHPKLVKRICLGPLYSPVLLEHRAPGEIDEREAVLREVFAADVVPEEEDKFVLFFKYDFVFSTHSVVKRGILSLSTRVREIFHIPQDNLDCMTDQSSLIQRFALVPHSLLQVLSQPQYRGVSKVALCKTITFDQKGDIHAV